MNVVACPSCSQQLKYNPQQAGLQVQCPSCQAGMILPGAPVANQPVDPLMGRPIPPTSAHPNLPGRSTGYRSASMGERIPKPQCQTDVEAISDPEFYKRILQRKGVIIGASSLFAIVVAIVIMNMSLGMAEKTARALPSDIPIPDFLKPDPDPPADAIIATLLLDEYDRYEIFKLTNKNKSRDSVVKWFNSELSERDWVFIEEALESRIWRKGNRRLVVFATMSKERLVVTIRENPNFEWNDEKLQKEADEKIIKSLLTAVLNHHDAHKRFPFEKHAAGEDADSGFSWVVYILPFIEKNTIYEKFDMEGDYKSPQNAALGNEAFEELVLNSGQVKWVRPSIVPETFGSIVDGPSNTVCLVQIRKIDNSKWTQPTSINPVQVITEFKGLKDGESMNFGMYDGSVRRITNKDNVADIEAMLEPADKKIPKNLPH